jgi:hypothetical protein
MTHEPMHSAEFRVINLPRGNRFYSNLVLMCASPLTHVGELGQTNRDPGRDKRMALGPTLLPIQAELGVAAQGWR